MSAATAGVGSLLSSSCPFKGWEPEPVVFDVEPPTYESGAQTFSVTPSRFCSTPVDFESGAVTFESGAYYPPDGELSATRLLASSAQHSLVQTSLEQPTAQLKCVTASTAPPPAEDASISLCVMPTALSAAAIPRVQGAYSPTHQQAADGSLAHRIRVAGSDGAAVAAGTAAGLAGQRDRKMSSIAANGRQCAAAGTRQAGLESLGDDPDPLELFVCPITQDLMAEPVTAPDGFNYERQALERWLRAHDTSPMTGCKLPPDAPLVPNYALRSAILSLQERKQQQQPPPPPLPP